MAGTVTIENWASLYSCPTYGYFMAETRKLRGKPAQDPWKVGVRHVRSVSLEWAERVDRIGPCRLSLNPDRFGTLVRAVIGQQISTRAAASIDGRLRELAGDPHTPDRLLALSEDAIRSCGLSGTKARYVLNLAEAVRSGKTPLHEYDSWVDESIVVNLTTVKGIGPWTAEMFLIFSMGRLDVLSVGDLGIRASLKEHHQLADLPTPSQCRELMEPHRPYRTIAMWYLWEEINRTTQKPTKKGV